MRRGIVNKIMLSFVILFTLISSDSFGEKRAWQLEDQFKIKRISELETSPDGLELIFVVIVERQRYLFTVLGIFALI